MSISDFINPNAANQSLIIFSYSPKSQPELSMFSIYTSVYGRMTLQDREYQNIKFFQSKVFGVYGDFPSFPSLMTKPVPFTAALPQLLVTATTLDPAASLGFVSFVSMSSQLFFTWRETHILVQADRFPNGNLPVQLLFRQIASSNVKSQSKYYNFLQIEPLQILNSSHASFVIPPGIDSGMYKVTLMINFKESLEHFIVLAIRKTVNELKLGQVEPADQVLAPSFKGQIQFSLSPINVLPDFTDIKHGVPYFKDLNLRCYLIVDKYSIIASG